MVPQTLLTLDKEELKTELDHLLEGIQLSPLPHSPSPMGIDKVRSLIEQYMGVGPQPTVEGEEPKRKRGRGRRRKSSIMAEQERIRKREYELNMALDMQEKLQDSMAAEAQNKRQQ